MAFPGIVLPTKATTNIIDGKFKLPATIHPQSSLMTMSPTQNSRNSPKSTTEKLSIQNQPFYKQALEESHTRDTLASSATQHNVSNSKSHNVKQHRIINSNVYHPVSGGVRTKGLKIEMPLLNDFFDHNEYLKKHERGFR